MERCGKCGDLLPADNDYVKCNGCDKGLHYYCAGVRETAWRKGSSEYKLAWKCISCRSKNVAEKALSQTLNQLISTETTSH